MYMCIVDYYGDEFIIEHFLLLIYKRITFESYRDNFKNVFVSSISVGKYLFVSTNFSVKSWLFGQRMFSHDPTECNTVVF